MMECTTAASVITYVSKIELDSAKLYEQWGKLNEKLRDSFEAFAKANRKNEKRVKRAYYSVVSDALETGFCFKNLTTDIIMPDFSKAVSVSAMVKLALEFERGIQQFYVGAARSSRALLGDVAREMEKIAQERSKRIEQLETKSETSSCRP